MTIRPSSSHLPHFPFTSVAKLRSVQSKSQETLVQSPKAEEAAEVPSDILPRTPPCRPQPSVPPLDLTPSSIPFSRSQQSRHSKSEPRRGTAEEFERRTRVDGAAGCFSTAMETRVLPSPEGERTRPGTRRKRPIAGIGAAGQEFLRFFGFLPCTRESRARMPRHRAKEADFPRGRNRRSTAPRGLLRRTERTQTFH